MRGGFTYLGMLMLLSSCYDSKWETIRGNGIGDSAKSIDQVIYFENELNGIVGGNILVKDSSNARQYKDFYLSSVPTMYITNNEGKTWKKVSFGAITKQSLIGAHLHSDTLICQTDSLMLFSNDRGRHFQIIKDSIEYNSPLCI